MLDLLRDRCKLIAITCDPIRPKAWIEVISLLGQGAHELIVISSRQPAQCAGENIMQRIMSPLGP